ncbi:ectonucleoside triphosphate diphosphohydrolase 2 isoform X2 [Equus quagga]|uniref:ectonucleoside triphosphate diphosphohydrolase 2 isoform X2 n=1 Tax=Equus quagga TaxID=89248 RepID=UPI001EE21A3B|nr:ectonucleoside triphosphate diphosphohydrolase 2 isoform X2 [Equus quagga]
MARKVLSLLLPSLLAAVGLAGLLLLCVPTRDVWEPPSFKVHALASRRPAQSAEQPAQAAPARQPWTPTRAPPPGPAGWSPRPREHRSRPRALCSPPGPPGGSGASWATRCWRPKSRELPAYGPCHGCGLGAVSSLPGRSLGAPYAAAGHAPSKPVRPPGAHRLRYGIVLDAGSSHTSMFIYKWPADKKNDTGIVSQHSSCNVHGGGISSYADNPSGAGQSLVECLDQALRDVPKDRHTGTPLYLGATAGMRLLNLTHPEAAANVLAAVTQTLTQYPFHFRGARILSGQDEGVFGWVTANYLLEKFIKTHGPHPCWPRGYSAQVQLQDVYDSPCTAAQGPLTFNSSASISLSGSSEPALCRSLVSQLFNFSSCHFSQCSFNGVFQPPVTGSFIAFSAFFYTVDFLRTVMGLPVATLQQLEVATTTLCSQTWSELQARAPGERAHLPNYCAGATFMHQLLSRGYGFDERAFSGVTFQNKAGDTAVGWALGYMLNLTNLIPADPPGLRKGTDFSSWVVLLLLFAAVLLAALVLLLRQARSAKSPGAI